jgi:Ran GTPase-activating protein (RanGAP) involved in mRNA processing and transport
MAAAVAQPILPASVPTDLGARVVVDLGAPILNIQKLENPQASLHNCGTKYGQQYVRSVFEKLEEKCKESVFEEINLSDNLIYDEGAHWLAKGLANNTNLKTLLLPRCGITHEGFKEIGLLLGHSPSMETLVMSSNNADDVGLKGEFCEGLAKNKTLKALYLGVCRLGEPGATQLCSGPLRNHPSLEFVSLTYNRLEVDAAMSISRMLATNQALRYLDLCGNSFGPKGAQELVKGLKENKGRLQKLGLAQCALKMGGMQAMVTFFVSDAGKNMEFLDLRHNRVGYHEMMKLREIMAPTMDEKSDGWLYLFNGCKRQLFANGSF